MKQLVIIAHDIRSALNVGALLRTADGFGVDMVYLTGYTPYPAGSLDDPRLPHEQRNIHAKISKTALGAESSQAWQRNANINKVIDQLRADGYTIAALEQTKDAIDLPHYVSPDKLAVVLGREVEGIELAVLDRCDTALVIPMVGAKESFNVVQAAAVVMYHCKLIA